MDPSRAAAAAGAAAAAAGMTTDGTGNSASEPVVLLEGWVQKQGHFFKTWKRRWLVVSDDMRMIYYEDDSKSEVKGDFHLKIDSSVTSLEGQPARPHLFAVRAEGSQGADLLIVSTDSAEDKARWMACISDLVKSFRSRIFS